MSQCKTPEGRKNRAGKRVPSELVAWDQYDDCADFTDTSMSLIEVSQLCRRQRVSLAEMQHMGGCLIREIAALGASPEWQLESVYNLGASKYGARSWQQGVETHLLFDAAWRHVNWHLAGEMLNREDGDCLHLAHALWQVIAVLWMLANRPEYCSHGKPQTVAGDIAEAA